MGTTPSYPGSSEKANPPEKTSWTIILNIVADDVLTNFAMESLKQLNESVSVPAGDGDPAEISVAAQLAFPYPTRQATANGTTPREEIRRYIFKPGKISPLAEKLVETNNPKTPGS